MLILLTILPASLLFADGDTLSINIIIQDVVTVEEAFVPQAFALHPPYPNPFNPDVNLSIDISEQTQTHVSIWNLRGQEIVVLENGILEPGRYTYQWHAEDHASGIYIARVRTEQYEGSHKISLLK
ncbi:MAG: T9SS type A sorting domain-containing protein [Candidatus Marinimicrobia bacterium]|nr:T9SS type A sorting domain-containing protein [Candidatus Neomarinimicrobiota bacterium]MBT5997666.1 T9SS type A sorting domain-containing protein [Candidatus Neomarinimicrobiota bacterium]MBT6553982.1 T9SS type A sorting domain-containing protein [Candidatus Neomarinimicrobiota bacterium]MBT6720683.1 T9SS type A sorting domain-containing protein [Candidatus Neomarinimicrobiota bacterium]